MVFVVLMVSGITLTISTCLNVWRQSLQTADLNQEARATMSLLSRDIRGAYLGLDRRTGYFFGMPAAQGEARVDTLEMCTESSGPTRLALLPDELRAEWAQGSHPVVSDYVAVRYALREDGKSRSLGLYRKSWVVPLAASEMLGQFQVEAPQSELISTRVVELELNYFDGEAWRRGWETTNEDRRLPWLVAVELTLCDDRERDHVYQTMVSIPAG